MFERVTYADLHFAGRKALEKSHGEGVGASQAGPPRAAPLSPACLPEPDEGELTYENIQGSRAQEEPPRNGQGAKGWSPRTRWAALGVLGIGLSLLSGIVSLGVRYTQASRQLQQASQDHAAERHVLQAGLEETRHLLRLTEQELNSTRVALWQSRAAENQTRQQLQHQVDQENHSLALLRRERASLMANLSQATSCQQIGCCSPGWKLFRWKCLSVCDSPKTWDASQEHCKSTSSQLLILKRPWEAGAVWPTASPEQSHYYWIGLRELWKGTFWVDQSSGLGMSRRGAKGSCVELHGGVLNWCPCKEAKRFICEKPANPWP